MVDFKDFVNLLTERHVMFQVYPVLAVSIAKDYVACARQLDWFTTFLVMGPDLLAERDRICAHIVELSLALGFMATLQEGRSPLLLAMGQDAPTVVPLSE